MSELTPIRGGSAARVGRVGPASSARGAEGAARTPGREPVADQVEVSPTARFLVELKNGPAPRQDLVDRVKGEIADGTYESADKVEKAVDEMMEDLEDIR